MSSKLFKIEIIQPKFDEIYSKFQNACDINAWANTGQDKMVQNLQAGKDINENVPKFLEVEPIQYSNRKDEKKKQSQSPHTNTFDLEKEKSKIIAIKFELDFQTARVKWFTVKSILDAIHRKLPPLGDAEGIITETVSLSDEFLTAEQKKMLPFVLKHAYNSGAVSFDSPKSSAVISSEPAMKFIEGENILIENLSEFESYKANIDELCDFIEREGKEKFTDTTKPSADEALIQDNPKPYTEVRGGMGYFKFYKQGGTIEIGKPKSRHYRLLDTLCNPHFGVHKTTDAIFDAIKLSKDKQDTKLNDYGLRKQRMLELIEFAKKELQKKKELQGKLKYQFDSQKNNMWLELEG